MQEKTRFRIFAWWVPSQISTAAILCLNHTERRRGINPLQVLNSSPNSRAKGKTVSTSDDETDDDRHFIWKNARSNLSGEEVGACGQVASSANPCGPVLFVLKCKMRARSKRKITRKILRLFLRAKKRKIALLSLDGSSYEGIENSGIQGNNKQFVFENC